MQPLADFVCPHLEAIVAWVHTRLTAGFRQASMSYSKQLSVELAGFADVDHPNSDLPDRGKLDLRAINPHASQSN